MTAPAIRCSEQQAACAIEVLEEMIRAARAGNQAGENAVVAAAHGLRTLRALKGLYETGAPEGLSLTAEEMQQRFSESRSAIAKAEGRANA